MVTPYKNCHNNTLDLRIETNIMFGHDSINAGCVVYYLKTMLVEQLITGLPENPRHRGATCQHVCVIQLLYLYSVCFNIFVGTEGQNKDRNDN